MSIILPPCQRDGSTGDWWGKQHEHCTGSQHVRCVAEPIVCECECHRALVGTVSPDGTKLATLPLDMRAAILGEIVPTLVHVDLPSHAPDPLTAARARIAALESELARTARERTEMEVALREVIAALPLDHCDIGGCTNLATKEDNCGVGHCDECAAAFVAKAIAGGCDPDDEDLQFAEHPYAAALRHARTVLGEAGKGRE